MLPDERTARRRSQASSRDVEGAEVTSLLSGLRKLHADHADLVRLERGTSEAIRRELNAERLAFREVVRAKVAAPGPKVHGDDDETTTVLNPPRYAGRATGNPTVEPLAHADLIGSEDISDEAARPSSGPDEETPPRPRRGRVLVEIYNGSREGNAS
jgi:hypothetical protein